MKTVAKVLFERDDGKLLVLTRSNHPHFGYDSDLPGGTYEPGEDTIMTAVREVEEEIGITIARGQLEKLYEGTKYSVHSTNYLLYCAKFPENSEIILSWEHSGYRWVSKDEMKKLCAAAVDTYMHMVGNCV